MLCGVKFCGGCNPRYDRSRFLKKIKKHFDGRIEFEYAKEEKEYDILLVIAGCTNSCAAVEQYVTKKGIVGIREKGQMATAIEELEKFLNE